MDGSTYEEIPPPDAVLYDDPAIQVLWRTGEALADGFVLMTFGDLTQFADGRRYFADKPAYKAKLPCIGIMAKSANWFPWDSMVAAAEVILAVAGAFRRRVLYGGSMGGYAAIKYSRLLGATEVIALCPQWSIDPAECEGLQDTRQGWFVPDMAGMGVRTDDVAGRVFVFADPADEVDRWHAARLAECCPEVDVIAVPSTGHHVTSVFAGAQNLVDLLDACLRRALPELRARVRRWRRGSHLRRQVLVERASRRHGRWIFPAVVRAALRNEEWATQEWHHLFLAAGWLQARGETMAARTLLRGAIPHVTNPWRQLRACVQLGLFEGGRVAVRTHHGTFLAYDLARDCCVHVAAPDGRAVLPLVVEALHPEIGLSAIIAEARLRLAVGRTGLMRVTPNVRRGGSRFEVAATKTGWFTLAAEGAFLSAEPSGRLVNDRRGADLWERFRFDTLAPGG